MSNKAGLKTVPDRMLKIKPRPLQHSLWCNKLTCYPVRAEQFIFGSVLWCNKFTFCQVHAEKDRECNGICFQIKLIQFI